MGLADAAVRGIIDSLAFRGSTAPYLLLDTHLRIRAANRAYEQATLGRKAIERRSRRIKRGEPT